MRLRWLLYTLRGGFVIGVDIAELIRCFPALDDFITIPHNYTNYSIYNRVHWLIIRLYTLGSQSILHLVLLSAICSIYDDDG